MISLLIVIVVCVCVCMCVFYVTFLNGVLAQSKTYTFVCEFRLGELAKGQSLDAAFRCGRINA